MCAQHKLPPLKPRPRRNSSLPWLGAGAGMLAVLGGVFWWGLGRAQPTPEKLRPDEPAMLRLLEESRALEREFTRIRDNRMPTTDDLRQLQRAIDNQREWMRATGSTAEEQQQRLRDLEALFDTSWVRTTVARSQADEAAGRALLAAGKAAEAVGPLRAALEAQRLLNQREGAGSGRDLPRETTLAQEVDHLEAEPISHAMAAAVAEGERMRDEKRTADALAAFHRAHDLQLRLNREFGRTQFASLGSLEKIEAEIATLDSQPLLDEVMDAAGQAADAQGAGRWQDAAALFEKAVAAQERINKEFPRSRHASAERVDALEVARQTELTAEAARRVAQLDRDIAAKLRTREPAHVAEMLLEGAQLQDAMFARYPRSRKLDAELRLKFNYLLLHKDELAVIGTALADQFRPVPGRSTRLMRTEVPQRLYELVMRSNPSRQAEAELPVESVSQGEAAEFCRRFGWVLGRPVRLPTEPEYRAALGEVPEGLLLTAAAWSQERSADKPQPVGSSAANLAGFYDLLGNVAEWLAPATSEGETTLVAGGSYADPEADLAKVPLEKRSRLERARTIGFRVVAE